MGIIDNAIIQVSAASAICMGIVMCIMIGKVAGERKKELEEKEKRQVEKENSPRKKNTKKWVIKRIK